MDVAQTEKPYVYLPKEIRKPSSPSTLPKGRNRFLELIPDIPDFVKQNFGRAILTTAAAGTLIIMGNSSPSQPKAISLGESITSPSLNSLIKPVERPTLAPFKASPTATPEPTPEPPKPKTESPILKWKDDIRTIVNNPLLDIPEEEQPKLIARLLALGELENKQADPGAISGAASENANPTRVGNGLMQVTPERARHLAAIYKIRDYKDNDLFTPYFSIFFGAADQARATELFGFDLAGWAFHTGEGRMAKAIAAFAISQGMDPEEVDSILNTKDGTRNIVDKFKITSEKLHENKEAMMAFEKSGAFAENTNRDYPIRLAALEKSFATQGTKA